MPVYWNDDEPKPEEVLERVRGQAENAAECRELMQEEEDAAEKYHPSARCPCEICQSQIADYTYDEAMDPDFVPPGVDD